MTKFKTPALKKLQEWAKANGLSNEALGTRLSCDTSQVWRWVNGDARPSSVKRILISQLTNGEVSELDWLTAAEQKELASAREKLGAA